MPAPKHPDDLLKEGVSNCVYALCHDKDVFYVGSAKDLNKRISTYKALKCHGNKRLLHHIKKGFTVSVLYTGDDFREKEVELIKAMHPRCNISILKYNNKIFGDFWCAIRSYQNRFGDTEFIKSLKNYFSELSIEDKHAMNERFSCARTSW